MGMRAVTPHKPSCPVIDLHGHAMRDVRQFAALVARYQIDVYGNGSVEQAWKSMEAVGIAWRIIKNVTTKAENVPAANDFAIEMANHPRLIPTGTIHLGYSGNLAEVERLHATGIRGIALDSPWQGFSIDDPSLGEIYKRIAECGMFIIAHCGIDPMGPFSRVETWPEHVLRVANMAPDLRIIAAHLGCVGRFELARQFKGYRGSNILLDIAMIMEFLHIAKMGRTGVVLIPADEFERRVGEILALMDDLGYDMIGYGSDYPWGNPGEQIEFWEAWLGPTIWPKVAYQNAARLLGIMVSNN